VFLQYTKPRALVSILKAAEDDIQTNKYKQISLFPVRPNSAYQLEPIVEKEKSVQVLHLPKKFKPEPLQNVINNFHIMVAFSGFTRRHRYAGLLFSLGK
jgi:hypothetical protein